MKKERKSFEEALEELESMVLRLENGEILLDESIEVFQKGVELSKFCSKRLDEAEKKIALLIEGKNGELTEEPF